MAITVINDDRTSDQLVCRGELAYARLNLRYNPFGELDWRERAALAVADVAGYAQQLARPGFAVQFLGEKGYGKTTHLLAIRRLRPGVPYVRIDQFRWTAVPQGSILLVDEVQWLSRWRRRRLFRPVRSLALGTHQDFAGELTKAGFAVETVSVAALLDAPRLCEILRRRIERARRGPGPLPHVSLDAACALLAQHGPDVRSIEWRLYDWIQRSQSPSQPVS